MRASMPAKPEASLFRIVPDGDGTGIVVVDVDGDGAHRAALETAEIFVQLTHGLIQVFFV